ncbi:hypothetical protein DYH09_17275 [bacterium CPR1]|nr:hypothetical protein [bacterium CPR1]
MCGRRGPSRLSGKQVSSRAGLTLLETLVSISVFLIVMIALLGIEISVRRNARQSEQQSDLHRQAALAMEQVASQLSGALVEPEALSSITYRRPLTDGRDQVVLGPGGAVEWGAPSTLRLEGTWLVLEHEGKLRRVADLGSGAEIRFARAPGRSDELEVKVLAVGPGREVRLQRRVALSNQR